MYKDFGAKVTTRYNIPSAHAFITEDYGSSCATLGSPFINNCKFNAAYESLNVLIPGIKNGTE